MLYHSTLKYILKLSLNVNFFRGQKNWGGERGWR